MRVSTLIDLLSKVHDSDAEMFIDPFGIEVRGEAGNRTVHFIPTRSALTSSPEELKRKEVVQQLWLTGKKVFVRKQGGRGNAKYVLLPIREYRKGSQ